MLYLNYYIFHYIAVFPFYAALYGNLYSFHRLRARWCYFIEGLVMVYVPLDAARRDGSLSQ